MGTSKRLSNRGLLVVVGSGLVGFGALTIFSLVGAPFVFAGLAVLLAVGLRALHLPRWLAGLGGLACFLGQMAWTVVELTQNVN